MKRVGIFCSISIIIFISQALHAADSETVLRYTKKSLKNMQSSCSLSTQSGKWTCATHFLHLAMLKEALNHEGQPTDAPDKAMQNLLSRCPAGTAQNAARLISAEDLGMLQQCKKHAQGICKTRGPGSKFLCSQDQLLDCSMQKFKLKAARKLSQSSQKEQ
jgi:hypothetical protein